MPGFDSLSKPLRALYARFATEEREDYAQQIARGGGGSLVAAVRAAKITYRRWGYVIRYATITTTERFVSWGGKTEKKVRKVGQLLTLYVRGTVERQRSSWRGKELEGGPVSTGAMQATPAKSRTRVDALGDEVQAAVSGAVRSWDREARAA